MSHQRFDLRRVGDRELLERLGRLQQTSAEVMADLLCHLAEVERRGLHLREATSSLFAYAVERLGCSEDEAWRRVHAARTAARFPVIFALIASGELTLTAVTKLEGVLTAENHEAVLVMAKHKTKAQVEVLVASLAPKADVAARVARVPDPARRAAVQAGLQLAGDAAASPSAAAPIAAASPEGQATASPLATVPTTAVSPSPVPRPARVKPRSPERWVVTVTIGAEAQRALETAKGLTRRTALQGNTALIIERALVEFAERLEARRRGKLRGRKPSVLDTTPPVAGVAEAANGPAGERPPHALARNDAAGPSAGDQQHALARNDAAGGGRPAGDQPHALARNAAAGSGRRAGDQPHALAWNDATDTGRPAGDQPHALARNDAADTGRPAGDQPHALARNDAAGSGRRAGDQPHALARNDLAGSRAVVDRERPAPARKTVADFRVTPRSGSARRRASVSRAVVRAVHERDGNRCTYRSADGRRCTETADLELHHIDPDARGGEPTADNITLHCTRHNQYQAVLDFGAEHVAQAVRRRREGGESTRDAVRRGHNVVGGATG